VVLDLYSRFVVAWMVAGRENSALAKHLLAEAITRCGIEPKNAYKGGTRAILRELARLLREQGEALKRIG
jgi:hypothetical protein